MSDEPTVTQALTWLQPVASAHAEGAKFIENRSWVPKDGTRYPLLLGLHAGKQWWTGPISKGQKGKSTRPHADGQDFCHVRWPHMPSPYTLPTGALLGVISVGGWVSSAHPQVARNPWALGPWCWLIDRVWTLEEPIPCAGAQGLWKLPDEHAAALSVLTGRAPDHTFDWTPNHGG